MDILQTSNKVHELLKQQHYLEREYEGLESKGHIYYKRKRYLDDKIKYYQNKLRETWSPFKINKWQVEIKTINNEVAHKAFIYLADNISESEVKLVIRNKFNEENISIKLLSQVSLGNFFKEN